MSLSEETRAAIRRHREEYGGTHAQALRYVMAEREAAAWNAKHPVGTTVTLTPYIGCPADLIVQTRTRSEAWVGGSCASVMVEGKSGGYGLSFVKATS
jgi:hypothetical protein